MRVVADTNVLVSAIVFGGPPGQLIELAAQGYLQLLLSPPLIDELRGIPRRKFGFSDAAVYQAETLLRRISTVVEPKQQVAIFKEDLADNRVLEAALAGDADVIVSGDHHLLRHECFGEKQIFSASVLHSMIQKDKNF